MALYQITSLTPVLLGVQSRPHAWAPESSRAGVSRKPPSVSLTVAWEDVSVGPTIWWSRRRSRVSGETGAACIRISLRPYCTYTVCHIKFRPPAMLSLFLMYFFFFPLYEKTHSIHSENVSTWSVLMEFHRAVIKSYLIKTKDMSKCSFFLFQVREFHDLFNPFAQIYWVSFPV